jgi:hypothetical protein
MCNDQMLRISAALECYSFIKVLAAVHCDKKVKLSLYEVVEACRAVRRQGFSRQLAHKWQ